MAGVGSVCLWQRGAGFRQDQVSDPAGPDTGTYRVVRGGSWNFIAGTSRSTERDRIKPSFTHNNLGFRVVCQRRK